MIIYIASDHAGFALKEELKAFLLDNGYTVADKGANVYDDDDDYPDYIAKVARCVAGDKGSFGVVFGKSGTGEAIVANKIKGVRAVVGYNRDNVLLARKHNDANVLSFGQDFITTDEAKRLVSLFFTTPFSNEERHIRRIRKITLLETHE